jgi:protein TonB
LTYIADGQQAGRMKVKENIPGFDDLIFESRNKEYGAYQLRKKYNSVLLAGIIFASVIGCSAVIIPFIINPVDERILGRGGRYVAIEMEPLQPPEEKIYVPPAPPPPENKAPQEILKYVAPEVVDTIVSLENTQASTDEILAHSGDSEAEITGTGPGDNLLEGEGGTDSDGPFFMVEVMPTFRGGDINNFREWVQKRTNYPQAAIENKIRGTVFLTFIVEKDGSVSNVIILKSVHPLIDNEAIKAITASPRWSPGLQRGQPVRVRYQISLNFVL